ncbi:hypothetical protein [Actinacidiphila oryziradicis]|jgi:hypothetical protein|uniref:hypothetical protein n=1 Tax=Actinacidiphila oryziradicis TaxID=2571141 RepID=UPI0023F0283D|nr:hypothetical protein [Actinacidiphila oryziradicis]MCW2873851.1 hypothetical protein [Actinacidiphila oryziradicis]
MDLAAHLSAIDLLRARPGCHITDLQISEDFWEDDGSRRPRVRNDFGAGCQALVDLLTERWGEPEVLDLGGHLEQLVAGERVAPPLDALCGYVPELYLWRPDGRWTAIGVGQGGEELPFQLVAAVSDGDPR